MKIGFLVERRYQKQKIVAAVVRSLEARGADVDVICAQECHFIPERGLLRTEQGAEYHLDRYDIVAARIRSSLGLAILAYIEAAGIPVINSYASVNRARNKATVAMALAPAGVCCAPTVLTDDAAILAELPASWFPLILKATHGDNSQGLRLIRRPEDLSGVRWGSDLVLAQHYLPNDGFDLKLYACGRRVFAVRKPSPLNTDPTAPPQRLEPDAAMIDLVLRCGDTLGLEIYGVDAIETADGLAVIEVNDFPNFTDIPEASEYVAEYILARVHSTRSMVHAYRDDYEPLGA